MIFGFRQQVPAHHSPHAKCSLSPVFVNKVLQEHSCVNSCIKILIIIELLGEHIYSTIFLLYFGYILFVYYLFL